jgi:hypothetical protein
MITELLTAGPLGTAACILVAACAGTIKEGMTRLEGRPLSAAIAKIGVPIEECTIAGKKVYIWGSPEMPTKAPKEKTCQIRATIGRDPARSGPQKPGVNAVEDAATAEALKRFEI